MKNTIFSLISGLVKNILCISFFLIQSNQFVYSQTGWVNSSLGQNNLTAVYFPSYNDTGFIVSSYESVYKSINGGNNWSNINTGSTYMGYSYFKNCQLGAFWGIYPRITANGGLNWNIMSIEIYSIGMGYTTGIAFLNDTLGFVIGGDAYPMPVPCCYDGVINKTTNGGQNWFEVYRQAGDQLQEIKFKDENNITVLDINSLVITTNAGINWTYSLGLFNDVFFFARSMTDPYLDTIYVAGYRSGDSAKIIKSTNRGNSWFVSLQLNFRSRLRKIFFLNGSTGYAVGDSGLIVRTTNSGNNWTVQNSGTRMILNGVWFLNKDTGFVVGDSGIVLKTTTGGVLTNYSSSISNIPDHYYLGQNYPNPFNPSTKIKFYIPEGGIVKIIVYDVLGKEVSVLVDSKLPAGSYETEFNARLMSGQASSATAGLASGMYFYRMVANNFSSVRKMLFIK